MSSFRSITELLLNSNPVKGDIIDMVLTETKDYANKKVYTIDSIVKEWLKGDINQTPNDTELGKLIREKYGI